MFGVHPTGSVNIECLVKSQYCLMKPTKPVGKLIGHPAVHVDSSHKSKLLNKSVTKAISIKTAWLCKVMDINGCWWFLNKLCSCRLFHKEKGCFSRKCPHFPTLLTYNLLVFLWRNTKTDQFELSRLVRPGVTVFPDESNSHSEAALEPQAALGFIQLARQTFAFVFYIFIL